MSRRGTALYCYAGDTPGCFRRSLEGNPKRCPFCGSAAFVRGRTPPRRTVQALIPEDEPIDDDDQEREPIRELEVE